MIQIDPQTPRWIQEFSRFVPIKHLLFVHGNILDLVSYPVSRAPDQSYWTESDLHSFFYRYFEGIGYEIIGHYDPLDGLQFRDDEQNQRYQHLLTQQRPKALAPQRNRPADAETTLADLRLALANRETPCVFILSFASRLLSSPNHLSPAERALFTQILKAALGSREVRRPEHRWNNLLILVCDKLNDLPPFLYVNNPRARSIVINKPDSLERARFIQSSYKGFYQTTQPPTPEIVTQFGFLTEGLSYYELLSLMALSQQEKMGIDQLQALCDRYKYGIQENAWDNIDKQHLNRAEEFIRQRIKGQDSAVARVLTLIKRAKLGLSAGSRYNQRPRGVLFFAGPTGVGKTELAKSIAELLFGHEDRLIRFDMSEYAAPHADQKLLGSPPGYVGYEEGGQLTKAMKARPLAVLLFDEIEKAHPSLFDKFLQILDDGRLTDGKGETVYFAESIIIFTSNLGTVRHIEGQPRETLISSDMSYATVRETILSSIRDHFNFTLGRPEILNRFGDNFVVFDFIRPPLDEQIVTLLLTQFAQQLLAEQNIQLRYSQAFSDQILHLARQDLSHGGRGIRNLLDSALVNPLASWLFDQDILSNAQLEVVRLIDHGTQVSHRFEVELATPHPPAMRLASQ